VELLVDPPAALEDEPEDEHPAARTVSSTAAAPAVGTTKDRFILAPSRETWSAADPDRPGREPFERAAAGLVTPREPACSAAGNLLETCLVDLAAAMTPMSRPLPSLVLGGFRGRYIQEVSFRIQVLTSVTWGGTLYVKHCSVVTAALRNHG
jgi:hypothetical protein